MSFLPASDIGWTLIGGCIIYWSYSMFLCVFLNIKLLVKLSFLYLFVKLNILSKYGQLVLHLQTVDQHMSQQA